MTLEYIHNNLWYDLIITYNNGNTIKLSGKFNYVTEHVADGIKAEISISDSQPSDIQTFIDNYKKDTNGLSIEEFYKRNYA